MSLVQSVQLEKGEVFINGPSEPMNGRDDESSESDSSLEGVDLTSHSTAAVHKLDTKDLQLTA